MIRLLRLLIAPLAFGLIVVLATPAHAQLNLSWDDCGLAGSAYRTFACNTNSSPLSGINATYLVGSFVSPGLAALSGENAFVIVDMATPNLPPWWQITNSSGTVVRCRPNSVLATTFGDALGTRSCADFFGTHGCVGSTDYVLGPAANQGTIVFLGSVPAGSEGPVPAGEENFAFTLHIRNDFTVGSGACPGCADCTTLIFDHMRLTQAGGAGNRTLAGPPPGGRNFVEFNCLVDPAAPRTWGQIKALYR